MKINKGPAAAGLHCRRQSLIAITEQTEVVDLATVKVQPLRKGSGLDCLINGNKHVAGGFNGRDKGNVP